MLSGSILHKQSEVNDTVKQAKYKNKSRLFLQGIHTSEKT